jgi:hypothetical protein
VINTSETHDKNAFKEAYDAGLERFATWLESLPYSQRQQLLELVVDKASDKPR